MLAENSIYYEILHVVPAMNEYLVINVFLFQNKKK